MIGGEHDSASAPDDPLSDASFDALFRSTAPRLFAYAARRVGREAAEEITAATFAQAWASRDRFDAQRGELVGWLFGIATNLVRQHFHQLRRRDELDRRAPRDDVSVHPTEVVDEALSAKTELVRVRAAVASLPEQDREVLLLRAWAGLSHIEIAESLDVEVGTVKSRLSRARRRLDAHLDLVEVADER
jgi:RNA polymerase sigma factor (sigma-70 family)